MRATTGPTGTVPDALDDAVAALVAAVRDAIRAELAADVARGPAPERLLSVTETAALMGVSRSMVAAMVGRGDIRSIKVGRRRLIPASAIDEISR